MDTRDHIDILDDLGGRENCGWCHLGGLGEIWSDWVDWVYLDDSADLGKTPRAHGVLSGEDLRPSICTTG